MKLASRVSKTRNLIRTRVLETRVKCFLLTLARQNCQVEPRGYRVYKTRDMLKYNNYTLSTAHYKPEKFKHTVTHSHPFSPPSQTHSLSLTHSLTHSFIKQNRGPNLKQICSHCQEGSLSSNRSSFSTSFVAHRAEGTLSFFWMLSHFCFLDSSVSLSPILDFGISWFDLGFFGSFWVFFLCFFCWCSENMVIFWQWH